MSNGIRRLRGLSDVLLINLPVHADDRGDFRELFRKADLEEVIGVSLDLVQGNFSRSRQTVLRGIHRANYAKVIFLPSGEAHMVFVDLREHSPSFGSSVAHHYQPNDPHAIYVPPGIGNSFYVLSPEVHYVYLVGDYYHPSKEITIRWDDPDLAIQWPLAGGVQPILSQKDREAPTLRELFPHRFS